MTAMYTHYDIYFSMSLATGFHTMTTVDLKATDIGRVNTFMSNEPKPKKEKKRKQKKVYEC